MESKKCLLKKTKLGGLAFCKDEFDFDRYSANQIMECLRNHNVEHCIDCEFYPKEVEKMKWKEYKCNYCGHKWTSRRNPKKCPRCHNVIGKSPKNYVYGVDEDMEVKSDLYKKYDYPGGDVDMKIDANKEAQDYEEERK